MKMSAKFKCVECGENEVDNEDDVCDECAAEQEDFNEGDDE